MFHIQKDVRVEMDRDDKIEKIVFDKHTLTFTIHWEDKRITHYEYHFKRLELPKKD